MGTFKIVLIVIGFVLAIGGGAAATFYAMKAAEQQPCNHTEIRLDHIKKGAIIYINGNEIFQNHTENLESLDTNLLILHIYDTLNLE